MNRLEYSEQDGVGLAQLLSSRQVSPEEVLAAALDAIEAINPHINAVVEVWPDEPRALPGLLHGVPMLVKDLGLTTRNRLNELGSRLAQGCVAPDDSELMSRLRRTGLVALGRTTLPELAASTTSENRIDGPTRNPWDLTRSAGGSSGGSAAAVAAGLVPIAHATDGGGSIRVPAASCGLFGLKPSRGRLPMGPAVDEVWAGLAVHGVLTRSVRDTALVLDLVHGPAQGDPFQINPPVDTYTSRLKSEPRGLRIAVQAQALNGQATHPVIEAALTEVVTTLEMLGHQVTFLTADIGLSWEAFVELNARFWSSNTAAWIDAIAATTGRPIDGSTLEPATLALYNLGKGLSATDLLGAMFERNIVSRHMGRFFQDYDLLLTPTLPDLAPFIGTYNAAQETLDGRGWIARVFSHSPFTALANVTGSPAMSVPLAHDPGTDLPIGMQFAAAFGREDLLIELGAQLERAVPWAARRPILEVN
ncbi:amidase [Halopseudomonas pelagia]|uniref:amidase n=1 Tax=Halopseudomonas pelagia TaxID=553151 RepID=UPI00039A0421|nr:amidase [Halopseudomonas pelagia]|tara:strand:- start:3441 stop:4871 length:1431 start_codon:yes stop_codon:yes gene_type:complete